MYFVKCVRYCVYFLFIFSKLYLFGTDYKEVVNFGLNPGNLKLFTFNTLNATNKPVVFVLHGCSQNANNIEEISDWKKLALKNNFTVFYPQQKILNNSSFCFNWFLDGDINKNGECLSIYHMIRYAIDSLNVDSTRIFFYGVSAGACMSEVICANYPWLINGAAICAGIPFKTATGIKAVNLLGKTQIKTELEWGNLVRSQNLLYKKKYPKIIVVHGTADFVADYGYAKEIIKQWANVKSLKSTATDSLIQFEKNEKVDRFSFHDNQHKEEVIFYKISGIKHQLPVDVGDGEKQGGSKKLFSTDIDFFLTYYIAKDFGLIK